MGPSYSVKDVAGKIDHTLLKPDATTKDIEMACEEAIKHGFFGVCINSGFVPFAYQLLQPYSIKLVSVVGFPLGANLTDVKVFECASAINKGADEIDMVIAIGKLKERDFKGAEDDISAVVREAWGRPVKVIVESGILTEEEKINACKIVANAGAQFIKTSTGFTDGGATIEDILLFQKHLPPHVAIKASGGIKNLDQAKKFLQLGVQRLGTSSGVKILQGLTVEGNY